MKTPVLSVYSEANSKEAAQLMKEKRMGSLLIKECEGYVRIFLESDLVYKLAIEVLAPKTIPLS